MKKCSQNKLLKNHKLIVFLGIQNVFKNKKLRSFKKRANERV